MTHSKLTSLQATFVVSSPIFVAGNQNAAERAKAPEDLWRPQSFIGALAFWWRALAWSQLQPKSAATLYEKECTLFGGPDTGQGLFVLSRFKYENAAIVTHSVDSPVGFPKDNEQKPHWKHNNAGLTYLVGQGIKNGRKGIFHTPHKDAATLKVTLLFRPVDQKSKEERDQAVKEIVSALIALGTLGGMGARARRALGSLSLSKIEQDEVTIYEGPNSIKDYRNRVDLFAINASAPPTRPAEYSALISANDITLIELPEVTAKDALNWLGQQYHLFRGWGLNRGAGHEIGGEPALWKSAKPNQYPKEHQQDHDWFKEFHDERISPEGVQTVHRASFGLPLTFQERLSRANKQKVIRNPDLATNNLNYRESSISLSPNDRDLEKRASPLVMHLHRFSETRHAIALTLLDGKFLPGERKLFAKLKTFPREKNLPKLCAQAPSNYDTIRKFMKWLPSRVEEITGP